MDFSFKTWNVTEWIISRSGNRYPFTGGYLAASSLLPAGDVEHVLEVLKYEEWGFESKNMISLWRV